MPKVAERAVNPCESGQLRDGSLGPRIGVSRKNLHRVLFWLALSLVTLGFAFLLDKPVEDVFTLDSTNPWRPLAVYLSKAGEGWVIGVAGVMASLVLFWGQRFRASRMAILITTASLLTGASATVLRSLIGRTRPDAHEAQGFYGVWHDSHLIIGKYEFGAFPSGHAATVIGLAAAAWLRNRRLGTAALVYAGLVTWSRIALGCHHFSDKSPQPCWEFSVLMSFW